MKNYSILWFGQRWDEYRRRDVELISRLVKQPSIKSIILIEPALPITSISNLWRRNYDADGRNTWQRIFRFGYIWNPQPNIWVISPIVPFIGWGRLSSYLINKISVITAKIILNRLNVDQLILWIGYPYYSASIVGTFCESLFCYSLCEDFSLKFSSYSKLINSKNNQLSKKADLIFVVTEHLALQYKKYQRKVHVVPNGVDVKWCEKYKEKTFLMDDIKNIDNPIIGFVGGIDSALDFELIFYLAKKRPEWSIVMIGRISDTINIKYPQLRSHDNIHLLGFKPFIDIPNYIDSFDVCILPFLNNARNRSRSAMKLYAFMALGKPIVSRPVADAEKFSSIVLLAQEEEEFLCAIEKALINDTKKSRQARISMAETQSWDKRVEYIDGLLASVLCQK